MPSTDARVQGLHLKFFPARFDKKHAPREARVMVISFVNAAETRRSEKKMRTNELSALDRL
jgi:hypothetical protein